MSGARAQSASTGAAAASAAGRVAETRTSPPSAIAGLAAISRKYDRGPLPRLRAPLAAAVSHSSSRGRAITRRTGVTTTACAVV